MVLNAKKWYYMCFGLGSEYDEFFIRRDKVTKQLRGGENIKRNN